MNTIVRHTKERISPRTNAPMPPDDYLHETGAELSPDKLVLRLQSAGDLRKVAESICPRDQRRTFVGYFESDQEFVLEPASEGETVPDEADDLKSEIARVGALDDPSLETLAAQRSVKWEQRASRSTMVRRVAEAKFKPAEVPPSK